MSVQKKKNYQNMAFGVFLTVFSIIILIETRELQFGSAANMGPGYLPRVFSIFLLLCGIGYTVHSFLSATEVKIPTLQWKSVLYVVLAIASFALLLEVLGLLVATLVMTFFASMAKHVTRWKEMVIFSVCLSLFTVVVFIYGLELPLPIFPIFF